jgi:hypothetical protein
MDSYYYEEFSAFSSVSPGICEATNSTNEDCNFQIKIYTEIKISFTFHSAILPLLSSQHR